MHARLCPIPRAATTAAAAGTAKAPAQHSRLSPDGFGPAEHVELGYAITAHRAQGATVDTAHLLVNSSSMTRDQLALVLREQRRRANHAPVLGAARWHQAGELLITLVGLL